ncbi:MAG: hypothetical protein HKL91_02215 [Candidatus Eremiobacteraeota bacterium]|uniref:DUF11 domain-containing protein n=1 Tax=mine drainage metagenome TaxID=410659 RepID=E6PCQ9_9ZZZZ|nr:hypothetical protein [Candidatus Eremiobacteraeota bacterium]
MQVAVFRGARALVVFLFALGVGIASAKPVLHLELTQALVLHVRGGTAYRPVPATGARPGEELRFTVKATNVGDSPAIGAEILKQIPAGEVFRAGTVVSPADATVTYSLNGRSFSARPMLRVRKPDGTVVLRPAPPSSYRALRWQLRKPFAVHATAVFRFNVRIK